MKNFFGPVAACLCVAILFLAMTTPQQSQVSAGDVQQKRSDIQAMEALAESIRMQADVNAKLVDADQRTRAMIGELAEAVTTVRDELPSKASIVKLVSDTLAEQPKPEAVLVDGCDCTCGEKLADLQKQIDQLKAKVATLEARPAYATSAYSSSAAPVKSGGSTGSVNASAPSGGGSTGSATNILIQQYHSETTASGGSTGSVRASVASTAKYGKISVYTTPGCQFCPAAIAKVQQEYSANWEVEIVEESGTGKTYPYYRVCYGDQCSDEIRCNLIDLNRVITARLVSMGVPLRSTTSLSSSSTMFLASDGSPRRTPLRNAAKAVASVPTRAVGNAMAKAGSVMAQWGNGRAAEVALASAQYRAANRIKGHSPVDLQSGFSNGVGWSAYNSTPQTCFWNSRNRGAYASVQGADGYYSTLVLY